MEIHLIDFCKIQKLKISISIQDNENYRQGIWRAYKFLSGAANYKIEKEHWDELVRINKTRNKLVHHNGKLSFALSNDVSGVVPMEIRGNTIYLKLEEDLYKYFQTHNLIETRGVFYVTPNLEYCKHLIEFGFKFFGKLYDDFKKEKVTNNIPI